MEYKNIVVTKGMTSNVEPSMLPDDVCQEVRNMVFDIEGGLPKRREGQSYTNTSIANYPIRGICVNHRSNGDVYTYVICGGQIYYSTDLRTFAALTGNFGAGHATDAITVSNALDYEMMVWNDDVYVVGDADPLATNTTAGGDYGQPTENRALRLDGTTVYFLVDTTASAGSQVLIADWPSKGRYIIKQYGDRLANRIFVAADDANGNCNKIFWTNAITGDVADGNFTASYGNNYSLVGKDDGEMITGMIAHQGNIYVFKPHNIYRIIAQGDKESWGVMRIPTDKGALYHRTIKEWMGMLVWMSWDGVYALDGNTVIELSEPIRNEFLALPQLQNNSRFWLQTSQADFDAGTQTNVETVPESWEDFDTGQVGLDLSAEASIVSVGTSSTTITLGMEGGSLFTQQGVKITLSVATYITKVSAYMAKANSPTAPVYCGIYNDVSGQIKGSPIQETTSVAASGIGTTFADVDFTFTNPIKIDTAGDYWILFFTGEAVGYYGIGRDVSESGYKITYVLNGTRSYLTDQAPRFNCYGYGYPTSGTNTLVSATKDLGAGITPTAWENFEIDYDLKTYGTLTFWIDTSTDGAAWDGYVQVYNGQTPNVRTDRRYLRVKIVFVTTNGCYTPVVSSFQVNWLEGTANKTAAAIVYYNRYYLAVQGTDSTFNNQCWVIDRYKNWSIFTGIYATCFDIHNFKPISGGAGLDNTASSGHNGYVLRQVDGYDDCGSDFTAYFITKTISGFSFGATFRSLYIQRKAGVSFNVYANVDDLKTGNVTEWGTALSISATDHMDVEKETLNGLNQGHRIKFKVETTAEDSTFQFGGLEMGYLLRKSRR